MADFMDNKITPMDEAIKTGIESDKSIYILINEVLSAYSKEDLCQFQRRPDGTNPKKLWDNTADYTPKIAYKYNHFTGKLISVCKLLNKDTCKIEDVNNVLKEIAKADEIANDKEDISQLFETLDLKAGGKMKVGGQSGESSFSDVLAIAMRISKMDVPSKALEGVSSSKIKSWLEALTQKAIENKETCVAFLYNNVLAQVFPSIVASLKLTEAAVAEQETIVAFLRTYIPIFINRIQDVGDAAKIGIETAANVGAKVDKGLTDAIDRRKTSVADLALSDMSSKMSTDEKERLQKKTNRLASLEKAQKKLTDAKVKAADLKTELEGQKQILREVKTIVEETNTIMEEEKMMSEELTQINNELEHLIKEPDETKEPPQQEKIPVANAEPMPSAPPLFTEKEIADRKRAREEGEEINPKTPRPNPVGSNPVGSNFGGKRKTKKQQKKASKTKKPKRSQKKQTKKRKQRKTQQKKGKK